MLNETQQIVWDALCSMSGEEVAQIWTCIYGNQVLDDEDVVNELEMCGYIEPIDDEEEEED